MESENVMKPDKLYCYATPPIDWWNGAMPTEHAEARFNTDGMDFDFDFMWEKAEEMERSFWWDDDKGQNQMESPFPVWGFFPVDVAEDSGYWAGMAVWCAWNQSNHGSTFICSQIPLPHLGGNYVVWSAHENEMAYGPGLIGREMAVQQS